MKITTYISTILTSIYGLFIFASCSDSNQQYKIEGVVWNTQYHITYMAPKTLDDSIQPVLRKVELSLSPFCPNSLITRINNGEDVEVDSMLATVFETSKQVNQWSGGAFDPSVSPLINLWGFGYKNYGTPPTQSQIDSALMFVGIDSCFIVDNRIKKKHPRTEFNFSAITKGYGCDMTASMMRRNGCNDFMIEIGGDMAIAGKNPQGKPWRVMIDAPIDNDTSITHSSAAIIEVSDCGIATSGNYRNFRKDKNGKKTGHTINPKTGHPVITSTLSATVIASNAMMADALATACMAMPHSEALKMIEAIPSTSAMLITADSISGQWNIATTSQFPRVIK